MAKAEAIQTCRVVRFLDRFATLAMTIQFDRLPL